MTLVTVYKQATSSVVPVMGAYDSVDLTEQYFQMLKIFGPKMLSYMLGLKEPSGTDDYVSVVDGTSLPYHYNGLRDRLRTLHKVSQMILSTDSVHILRMWMIGQNPDLDYNPPATKIRNGDFLQVFVAADSYLTDGF